MVENQKVDVAALRAMLKRVAENPDETFHRITIAKLWLKKLDELDKKWEECDSIASGYDAVMRIHDAYVLRSSVGQSIDTVTTVIRDSAVIMFSEYLTATPCATEGREG